MKSLLTILILTFAFQISVGQEVDFEGNWYREIFGYDNYESKYYFFYYTKDDVIKAKRKFNLIKQSPLRDEWEGVYTDDGGSTKLHWNSEGGFIFYRAHHILGNLDYGTASNKKDSVRLVSEKPLNANQTYKLFDTNFIKVKFGDKHFLVPEEGIKNFTLEAAGLDTYKSKDLYSFIYWHKAEDHGKEVFGLPILPEKYKSLLRYPVKAKIIKVGKQKTVQSKDARGKSEKVGVKYFFTINAGKNKGLESGMIIYVSELKEWGEIDKVSQNSSTAYIESLIDSDGNEICRGIKDQDHECRTLSIGMNVQTQTSL